MRDPSVWEDISTAPFDRELELAVVERNSVHALVFACRRIFGGWINAQTNQRVAAPLCAMRDSGTLLRSSPKKVQGRAAGGIPHAPLTGRASKLTRNAPVALRYVSFDLRQMTMPSPIRHAIGWDQISRVTSVRGKNGPADPIIPKQAAAI
jgi:hypothetical protein